MYFLYFHGGVFRAKVIQENALNEIRVGVN